jgi:choline-sulfatase
LPSRTRVYGQRRRIRGRDTVRSPIICVARATTPGLSGKMHFVGPDQLHGFEDRLTTDIYPGRFRLDAGLP